jgi:hypothetical protein
MNLPPGMLRKLETEEDLEALMAQAAVITAGTAPQSRNVAAVAQGTSTAIQLPRQKSKRREESSPAHQPGEYELKVMEKRRRNQQKLNKLGLGTTQFGQTERPHQKEQPKANPAVPSEGIAAPEASPAPESPAVINFIETSDESTGQPETPAVAKPTEPGLTTGSVTLPNADAIIEKVFFIRCIQNERCRGPKCSLEQRCPGCNNYIYFCYGSILFNDEDGYKEADVLCPFCEQQSDPAVLCLPVTQYDEDTSKSGEDGSYVNDEDQCCCGCGQGASGSHHYCLHSMKRVLQIHYHPDQEVGELDGNHSYCLQCYGKVAHRREKNLMMKRRRSH